MWFQFSEAMQRRTAPAFCLPAPGGREVCLSSYRGRRNQVLIFLHRAGCPGCLRFLERLQAERSALSGEDAIALVILTEEVEMLAGLELADTFPYPLLADPDRAVRQKYRDLIPAPVGPDTMLVFLLDRYGAPFAAYWSEEPDEPGLLDGVVEWLQFIGLQCPE